MFLGAATTLLKNPLSSKFFVADREPISVYLIDIGFNIHALHIAASQNDIGVIITKELKRSKQIKINIVFIK